MMSENSQKPLNEAGQPVSPDELQPTPASPKEGGDPISQMREEMKHEDLPEREPIRTFSDLLHWAAHQLRGRSTSQPAHPPQVQDPMELPDGDEIPEDRLASQIPQSFPGFDAELSAQAAQPEDLIGSQGESNGFTTELKQNPTPLPDAFGSFSTTDPQETFLKESEGQTHPDEDQASILSQLMEQPTPLAEPSGLLPDLVTPERIVEPGRTGQLRKLVTGILNLQAVEKVPQPEMTDEEVTSRLEGAKTEELKTELPVLIAPVDAAHFPGVAPFVEEGTVQPRQKGVTAPFVLLDEEALPTIDDPPESEPDSPASEPAPETEIDRLKGDLSETHQDSFTLAEPEPVVHKETPQEYAAWFLGGEATPDMPAVMPFTLSEELQPEQPLWAESINVDNMRSTVLEDYAIADEPLKTPENKPAAADAPWRQKVLNGWNKNSSARKVMLTAVLGLVILGMVLTITVFAFLLNSLRSHQPSTRIATAISSADPIPIGLELTGGWTFSLSRSTLSNGSWKPVNAEWLDGAEVRRVVAIPWSLQSEALVQSLRVEDLLRLSFSNQQTLQYKVVSVERVQVSDTSIFTMQKPSLVIILYKESATQRWVVIAEP